MKQVHGVWLPDSDTHFGEHLAQGPRFNGHGTYQYKKILLALQVVKANGGRARGAIDVGAHVGLWSMVLTPHFCKVYAFEPVADHLACFALNLTKQMSSKPHTVELYPYAVGREAGVVSVDTAPDNSGNACVSLDHRGTKVKQVSLDAIPFDKPIDLIKIDVEGFELDVVKGGERIIRGQKPVLVVEQKPGHGQRYGYGERAAVDLLMTWGAKLRWQKSGDYCLSW